MKGITLIGMPAAGKATIARALAQKLNWPIYDIDDMMVEKEKRSPAETTRAMGKDYLLSLEEKCVAELDLHDSVLATPGSIIYVPACHDQLRKQTHIVWLDVELDVIGQRLANDPNNDRGVVGLEDGGLEKLFNEREPLYRALAGYTLDCAGKNPDTVAREITALVF